MVTSFERLWDTERRHEAGSQLMRHEAPKTAQAPLVPGSGFTRERPHGPVILGGVRSPQQQHLTRASRAGHRVGVSELSFPAWLKGRVLYSQELMNYDHLRGHGFPSTDGFVESFPRCII